MDLVVGFNVLDCWLVVSCCSYLFIVWLEFVVSSDLVVWCCGLVLLLLVLLLMLVSGWVVCFGWGCFVGCWLLAVSVGMLVVYAYFRACWVCLLVFGCWWCCFDSSLF